MKKSSKNIIHTSRNTTKTGSGLAYLERKISRIRILPKCPDRQPLEMTEWLQFNTYKVISVFCVQNWNNTVEENHKAYCTGGVRFKCTQVKPHNILLREEWSRIYTFFKRGVSLTTVCPRSLVPFYTATYYITWVKTSWTSCGTFVFIWSWFFKTMYMVQSSGWDVNITF